jgi:tetratricopeptide (TPR) repeat protein
MDRPPDRYVIAAAVAAIALGFTLCASTIGHAEHASTADIEVLRARGTALAESGHHEEAIPLLQQALTITRSQYGMFDLRQQDVLKTLAASLTAMNRMTEAQDQMIYRVRVAEKNYGEGTPKVIPSLCDFGNWFAEIGKTPEARMTFQVALNIAGDKDTLRAPIVVEPLRGIARAYMLRSSYPEVWRRRTWPGERNKEGEEALQRALQIVESDPTPETLPTRIETLIQMADWYQIKNVPDEALPYYQRAWQIISKTPSLPRSVSTALDVPLRVYYPTPNVVANVPRGRPEDAQSHHVQVEFTVAADGSVQDAHLVEHDTSEQYAQEIFAAVRASRFRPKFVDGQAVAAPGINYREIFWTGAPRE